MLSAVVPAHGAAADGRASSSTRPAAVVAIATQRVDGSRAGAATGSGQDTGSAVTTTTVVESGGPLPEVGPILVPTDDNGVSTRWWLVAFGGVQVVGLFLVTRRARSRLATNDIQP